MTKKIRTCTAYGAEGIIKGFKATDDMMQSSASPRRYSIQSDGDHKYFVEVGKEDEFEAWVEAEENQLIPHDYEKNRIDGIFTFTDPRCG